MKRWAKVVLVFWVAHWTATYEKAAACWGAPRRGNAYTGDLAVDYGCKERVRRPMRKDFESKQDANDFIGRCPLGVCADWRLEEVHD